MQCAPFWCCAQPPVAAQTRITVQVQRDNHHQLLRSATCRSLPWRAKLLVLEEGNCWGSAAQKSFVGGATEAPAGAAAISAVMEGVSDTLHSAAERETMVVSVFLCCVGYEMEVDGGEQFMGVARTSWALRLPRCPHSPRLSCCAARYGGYSGWATVAFICV